MGPERRSAARTVLRFADGVALQAPDQLAEEVPVALRVNDEPFAVMMASPHDLDDFARGFALTEAGIAHDQIVDVQTQVVLEGIRIDLITRDAHAGPASTPAPRTLPGRSGCGVCGLRELEDVMRTLRSVRHGRHIERAALERAIAGLPQRQPLNAESGALHAAAWADADGNLQLVREDVGRHNALDKLIGALLREEADRDAGFALITSRASYEMVAKAATADLPILVAISAPTALAVDVAQRSGVTLAGFVRPGRHVIYSHAWRLDAGAASASTPA